MNTWKKNCRQLFKKETPTFYFLKMMRQPSFLLASFFLLLGILPLMAFRDDPSLQTVEKLKKLGWHKIEDLPCPRLKANHFFEVDYGNQSKEIFVTDNSEIVISPGQMIDAEFVRCHPIKKPSLVEEI